MRYRGVIGLRGEPIELAPGVWTRPIEERPITGSLDNKPVRWRNGERVHEGVSINHIVKILGPDTLMDDFAGGVYITWQNRKWAIAAIEYRRPRIYITLGGIYHE